MMLLRSDHKLSLLSFDFCFYRHISSPYRYESVSSFLGISVVLIMSLRGELDRTRCRRFYLNFFVENAKESLLNPVTTFTSSHFIFYSYRFQQLHFVLEA